jgi:hypothetical protein
MNFRVIFSEASSCGRIGERPPSRGRAAVAWRPHTFWAAATTRTSFDRSPQPGALDDSTAANGPRPWPSIWSGPAAHAGGEPRPADGSSTARRVGPYPRRAGQGRCALTAAGSGQRARRNSDFPPCPTNARSPGTIDRLYALTKMRAHGDGPNGRRQRCQLRREIPSSFGRDRLSLMRAPRRGKRPGVDVRTRSSAIASWASGWSHEVLFEMAPPRHSNR